MHLVSAILFVLLLTTALDAVAVVASACTVTQIDSGGEEFRGIGGSSDSNVIAVGHGNPASFYHYDGTSWTKHADTSDEALHDVSVVSGSLAYAVAHDGRIMQYDGTNWTIFASPSTEYLTGVWAESSSELWIVGKNDDIWRWDGSSWTDMSGVGQANIDAGQELGDVWADSNSLYTLEKDGDLYRYTRGSGVWDKFTACKDNYDLDVRALWSDGAGKVYIAGQDKSVNPKEAGIFLYDEGTNSCSSQLSSNSTADLIEGIYGYGNVVYAVGKKGLVIDNSSGSWAESTEGTEDLKSVWVSDTGTAYYSGKKGYVTSCEPVVQVPTVISQSTPDTTPVIYGAFSSADATELTVTVNSVTYTLSTSSELTNSGDDWTLDLSSITPLPLGTYEVVATWTDGIDTISDATSDELVIEIEVICTITQIDSGGEEFRGIGGSSDSNVIAVGHGKPASFYHYDGTSWTKHADTSDKALHDVAVLSDNLAYAVAHDGRIMKYDGSNWTISASPSTAYLTSIWAESSSEIWIVGKKSDVWRWDGSSWTDMSGSIDVKVDLEEVWGDSNSLYLVEKDGDLYRYTRATGIWDKFSACNDTYNMEGLSVWSDGAGNVYTAGKNKTTKEASVFLYNESSNSCSTVASSSATDKLEGIHGYNNIIYAVGKGGLVFDTTSGSWTEKLDGTADYKSVWVSNTGTAYYAGKSGFATVCTGTLNILDHFAIDVGAGSASTCSPFSFTVTAEDSNNVVLTEYAETVSIVTSTSQGNFSTVTATNNINPNPDNDDNGSAFYTFDVLDSGSIVLSLANEHAETLNISITDSIVPVTSTSTDITFSDNAFTISDTDSAVAGDDVPVAGRDHSYQIQMIRKDPVSGCGVATGYDGVKPLKMWRTKNASDPSTNSPALDGDTLPSSDSGVNGSITFTAGVADVTLTTSDIGKFTIELADISNSFAAVTIAGTSSQQIVRPFGIGIDFENLRDADFSDNGSIDDSNGADLSFAAGIAGSIFTQAGENFKVTVAGVLWSAADDADNNGEPDAATYLGNNLVTPSFAAEGETITLTASVFEPAGALLGSFTVNGTAGGLFDAFTSGIQTDALMTYSNVGIIDISANLTDADYFSSGVNITGSAPNVGRFNPYQYAVTSSLINDACTSGGFTYSQQEFTAEVTLEAQNKSNSRTDGFRDSYATLVVGSELNIENSETGAAYDLETFTTTQSFSSGTMGSTQFDIDLQWDMGLQDKTVTLVNLIDSSDEVTRIAASPVMLGSTEVRYGRLALDNIYGSELIDLTMPMKTEYFDGANFIVNTSDDCTVITDTDLSVVSSLSGGSSTVSVISTTAASGVLNINLTAPGAGNSGDIRVTPDLNASSDLWLRFNWDGVAGDEDPSAKATFGIYSGDSSQIYYRQIYR